MGQVATPTMGWSSWNTFSVNISEDIIKGQADAMVSQGLAAVGYQYINIDDGFQGGRDETGRLKTNPTRFPNGLKVVSDYIHSKGLKAGIYSDAGSSTCGSMYNNDVLSVNVGFYRHDQQDADYYFKENEFDFIKVDYCGGDKLSLNEQERYTAISNAIRNTGRDVRYNLCRWAYPGTWCNDISTSWRTTGDIYDGWQSVKGIIAENLYLSAYCYGGCYNDMDMLEVGRSMTMEEDRTHFGMWCIMSSPLLIGCNMATIRQQPLELLKNTDLIALNQDPLGLQAYVVQHQGDTYVLVKDLLKLNGTTRAVALYNPSDSEVAMSVSFDELDLGGTVMVRDLYERRDLGAMQGALSAVVPPHGTRIYRLEAERRLERYIYEAETAHLGDYQEIYNNETAETAVYQENGSASGRMFAGWLGKRASNDMQWRNVYSAEGGDYVMKIWCATQEDRYFSVQINGTDVSTVKANSGAWGTFKEYELTVHLSQGSNIVRLYNDGSWMPNIDFMELHRVSGDDVSARRLAATRSRLVAMASVNTLTPAFQTAIAQLVAESETEGMDETQISAVTARLDAMISDIDAAASVCRDYARWKANAERNIKASAESQSLTAFAAGVQNADEEYAAAPSTASVSSALASLKSAVKTYLMSPDANPADGETLDMTFLFANFDFSETTGWNGSPTYRSGCGEAFNKVFNVYQSLASARPGIYTVSVNALFRNGSNDGGAAYSAGTETIPAVFYVNTERKPVASLYSYSWQEASQYGSVDNLNGFPHSMYAAGLCFSQGAYANTIVFRLEQQGTLRIGLRCNEYINDAWCCFDNLSVSYQPLPLGDGIATVSTVGTGDAAAYDMRGRRVEASHKGIVIKDGDKYVNR